MPDPRQTILRSGNQTHLGISMETRPEYREATEEGKPKSVDESVIPGAISSVGFRPQKTIQATGKGVT